MLEEKLAHEHNVTQLQRNFVSMITHEFRTPLTQIDAQAQRLISLKDRLRGEDIVERAGRVRAAVARIVRLIDNLVDTSRLLDGDTGLFFHAEPIDLAAVLRDACCLHRETSPGVDIVEEYGALPLPMRGDPRLLFQVFSNLLSNAIKYSPDGATVVLRAGHSDGVTTVVVEDHGIGIPAAGPGTDIHALLPRQQCLRLRRHRGRAVPGGDRGAPARRRYLGRERRGRGVAVYRHAAGGGVKQGRGVAPNPTRASPWPSFAAPESPQFGLY